MNKSTFEKRCNKLVDEMKKMNISAMLVTSETSSRYFSGFTGDNVLLVISGEHRILFTDFRYTIQAKQQSMGAFEVNEVSSMDAELVKNTLSSLGATTVGYEDETMTVRKFNAWKDLPFEFVPSSDLLTQQRVVKSEEEIEYLKIAQQVSDKAFAMLLDFIKPGMTEKEVANELDYLLKKCGADEPSFDTIVGSGENGALCHAVPGDRKLREGDLVVIDFGSRVNGYCSDMTRTIAIGEPCDELKKIYNIVREAQAKALSQLKAGLGCKEFDAIARDYITEHGYGKMFGHSLGHGFGLEIHETPFASIRGKGEFKAGMTITCEPGIYVEGLGGVRIEDCTVVTDDGYINLCSTTKDLIVIK